MENDQDALRGFRTDQRRSNALDLREKGRSLRSIALEVGVPISMVRVWLGDPSMVRVRTEHPGIYRRGKAFAVIWRDGNGKQRERARPTLAKALQLRAEKEAERDETAATILRAAASAKVRQRADLSDAYGYVRQALQAVDRARLSASMEEAVRRPLVDAEERVAQAMREET